MRLYNVGEEAETMANFDYSLEPKRDILFIDVKSFYASVECAMRGYDPLRTMLVVMSTADNTGNGLILASSPMAKKSAGDFQRDQG